MHKSPSNTCYNSVLISIDTYSNSIAYIIKKSFDIVIAKKCHSRKEKHRKAPVSQIKQVKTNDTVLIISNSKLNVNSIWPNTTMTKLIKLRLTICKETESPFPSLSSFLGGSILKELLRYLPSQNYVLQYI